ncbi:MAG: glycosyltransferase family 2 protein [Phocaeicola plebeius]|nr:glycosyltransferase family 2 protein [Phocaeicola plebeius]
MKKVAVVILNWNGAAMLQRFLPSVVRCSEGRDVEVCVADNGSTDLSCRVVETEFPTVRLIRLSRNYGFAEGYNRAICQVEAEYVVLLNSDVEVTEGWLDPLMAYMETHPDAAACQPKLLSERQRDTFEYAGAAGGFIDRYGYPFCRGRLFDGVEKDEGQYDAEMSVFWASGAALFVRRRVYQEVGGLDARFFAHMEEIDLCWRMRHRGYDIVCVPQSVVYHVGAATLKKENPRKTYLNFRNNLLMLYKNLPSEELHRVLRVRACLDGLAALVFLLKGETDNFRAVWQARRDFRQMRSEYVAVRSDIQQHRIPGQTAGRSRFSLLWQCKVLRKKRFMDLPVVMK